jgi:acyl carrier protein
MLEKIKEVVAEQLNVEVSTIGDNSTIKEELGADSLDLFEIIMALEEEFDVEIPTEDLENIKTISDVSNYLNEKKVEN